jgi:hypothetical protein
MAKPKKAGRGKVSPAAEKASEQAVHSTTSTSAGSDAPRSNDPLRAYPPDPPRPNGRLLMMSAIAFIAWFFYLAYVALRG